MINDQDKRAVEGMARCGIELEGLIATIPKFQAEDIEAIYKESHKMDKQANDINISINCS